MMPRDTIAGECLLQHVPNNSRHLLVIADDDRLATVLQSVNSSRQVTWMSVDSMTGSRENAAHADCIVVGVPLERIRNLAGFMSSAYTFLEAQGCMLAIASNPMHHSRVAAILRGDERLADSVFESGPRPTIRSLAELYRILLDAQFLPDLAGTIGDELASSIFAAFLPLVLALGLHEQRARFHLSTEQFVVRAHRMPDLGPKSEVPMTFAVCVSDTAVLRASLMASPCLQPGNAHEVISILDAPSAADGLNAAVARARNDLVVCVHQDVYLPRLWPSRFQDSWQRSEAEIGDVGIAGVYGVVRTKEQSVHAGCVVDRDRLLFPNLQIPAIAETLDELLLVVPRDRDWQFDNRLDFHLYGADACLQVRQCRRHAVVLHAPCFHNSRNVDLPKRFFESGRTFAAKWTRQLPITTTCANIDWSWVVVPQVSNHRSREESSLMQSQ